MRDDDDDDDELKQQPDVRRTRQVLNGRADVFLHGVWRDEIGGSTIYIDGQAGRGGAVYCHAGDHSLTGVYEDWRHDGNQYIARFRWLDRPISGWVALQIESNRAMVGGWWYEQDVPPDQVARLPFVAGIHPVRWVLESTDKIWPDWAVQALGISDKPPISAGFLSSGRRPKPPIARTSEDRYRERLAVWLGEREGPPRWAARLAHHGWWLLHNLAAHPLLALTRGRAAVAFHDWTSMRLNRMTDYPPSPPPRVERSLWWRMHNLAAHVAIGLAPCAATFRWHDETARRMQVRGWV